MIHMLEARAFTASDAAANVAAEAQGLSARSLLQNVAPVYTTNYVNCSGYLTVSNCRPNFLGTGVNILPVRTPTLSFSHLCSHACMSAHSSHVNMCDIE